jgi:hypothetical protein
VAERVSEKLVSEIVQHRPRHSIFHRRNALASSNDVQVNPTPA